MKASEIASRAASLISGDRNSTHGDIVQTHAGIAEIWNAILTAAGKAPDTPLDAHDVALLMAGMKIARAYNGAYNEDDYTDAVGYMAIAGEIRARKMR
jgi:hypothetical protein